MNGEVNTMTQLMLAQNAGASTDTIHAAFGAPALVAAGFILAILILYAVIRECETEDDKFMRKYAKELEKVELVESTLPEYKR